MPRSPLLAVEHQRKQRAADVLEAREGRSTRRSSAPRNIVHVRASAASNVPRSMIDAAGRRPPIGRSSAGQLDRGYLIAPRTSALIDSIGARDRRALPDDDYDSEFLTSLARGCSTHGHDESNPDRPRDPDELRELGITQAEAGCNSDSAAAGPIEDQRQLRALLGERSMDGTLADRVDFSPSAPTAAEAPARTRPLSFFRAGGHSCNFRSRRLADVPEQRCAW